jgi:hypothetical protein
VATWLLVQLVALALAALRIPLAAAYPQPAELHAVQILLIVQFACISILFPSLLQTWSLSLIVATSAWVMLIFAAALAAWPVSQVMPVATFLSLWILVLATLRVALTWRWQLVAAALLSVWIIGGLLLDYLASDFGPIPPTGKHVAWTPLSTALASAYDLPSGAWLGQVVIELLIVSILAFARLRPAFRSS